MNLSLFALRRGAILTITMLLAFALAACAAGDGDASEPAAESAGAGDGGSGTATVTDGSVEITAENLEFSATTIEAPAGEPFTITLVNNDTAPHNISVYTEEGGEVVVEGAVINQGETVEVEVDALDAGEYYFLCDIHPEMNGSVVVA